MPAALQVSTRVAHRAAALQDQAVEPLRRQVVEQRTLDLEVARGALRGVISFVGRENWSVVVEQEPRAGVAATQPRARLVKRDAADQPPVAANSDDAEAGTRGARQGVQI